MTDRIEAEAMQLIQQIDDMGGVVPAIESGFIQRQIEQSAYEYGKSIEDKQRIIVGVNEFTSDKETPMDLFHVSEEIRNKQMAKITDVKAKRDNAKVEKALDALKQATGEEKTNVMPLIVEAVKEYATIGEICGVLRNVFGEYQEAYQM